MLGVGAETIVRFEEWGKVWPSKQKVWEGWNDQAAR